MTDGINLAISGTSGIALFFSIWFYFPKYNPPKPDDGFNFSIPENWTFQMAVEGIVKSVNSLHEFIGLSQEELSIQMKSHELRSSSAIDALKKLKYLNDKLPKYSVILTNNIYTIKKIENGEQ